MWVGSPRAANTTAAVEARRDQRDRAVRRRASLDMALDVLHLLGPTAVVHAEGLVAAVRGDAVEARFGHRPQGAVAAPLDAALDPARTIVGIVDARLHRLRMPGEREQLLRSPFIDPPAPRDR